MECRLGLACCINIHSVFTGHPAIVMVNDGLHASVSDGLGENTFRIFHAVETCNMQNMGRAGDFLERNAKAEMGHVAM